MDTVEFFKTANRLCKDQGCNKCPACKEGMCMVMRMIRLDDNSVKSIEETILKVEQWAKDHPVKTRQSEFLKKFPNAYLNTIPHYDRWIWTATPWFCGYKDSDTGCGAAMVRAADIGGWFGTVSACLSGAVVPACILNPKFFNMRQNMAYVEEVAE